MVRSAAIVITLMAMAIGCTPPAPVGAGANPVPKNAAATCAGYCQSLGLTLDSVVIMASNVGCVCSAHGPPQAAPQSSSSAGAAGGMATILLQQQAAAASAQSQQQHR
jgi:hypothetical protein